MSDTDLHIALSRREIVIKAPKRDSKGEWPRDYEDAISGHYENPPDCLESTGYQLRPDAFWNGDKATFEPIPESRGYVLKPGRAVVIRSLQRIELSEHYCALHFGRYSKQMSGISVGSGLIQPEWGLASPIPIYIHVRNNGKASFAITRGDPISRLLFFRMTSPISKHGGTSEEAVLRELKRDMAVQEQKEKRRRFAVAGLYLLGVFAVVVTFFLGPVAFPILHQHPQINDTFGGLLTAAFVYLGAQVLKELRQ